MHGPSTAAMASAKAGARDAALLVGRHADELPLADAEHAQGDEDRRVHLLPHHDRDRRAAGEAVALRVLAAAREHGVAGGREAGEVGHGRARHEAGRAAGREVEQVEDPLPRDLLDHRRSGRGGVQARVLVPRRREPVGGERRGQRAPDDEAEVARARTGREAGVRAGGERLDDVGRVLAGLRQRAAERGAQGRGVRDGTDVPLREAVEVGDREPVGALELVVGGHAAYPSSASSIHSPNGCGSETGATPKQTTRVSGSSAR